MKKQRRKIDRRKAPRRGHQRAERSKWKGTTRRAPGFGRRRHPPRRASDRAVTCPWCSGPLTGLVKPNPKKLIDYLREDERGTV